MNLLNKLGLYTEKQMDNVYLYGLEDGFKGLHEILKHRTKKYILSTNPVVLFKDWYIRQVDFKLVSKKVIS